MRHTKMFLDLLKNDHRFSIESYRFVNEAIDFAQKKRASKKDDDSGLPPGHVTGQDLCRAVLELALEQFGFMARLVMANLGFRKTGDIGDAVYNLISVGYMKKVPEDSREDFDNVFDLGAELDNGFAFRLNKDK